MGKIFWSDKIFGFIKFRVKKNLPNNLLDQKLKDFSFKNLKVWHNQSLVKVFPSWTLSTLVLLYNYCVNICLKNIVQKFCVYITYIVIILYKYLAYNIKIFYKYCIYICKFYTNIVQIMCKYHSNIVQILQTYSANDGQLLYKYSTNIAKYCTYLV